MFSSETFSLEKIRRTFEIKEARTDILEANFF